MIRCGSVGALLGHGSWLATYNRLMRPARGRLVHFELILTFRFIVPSLLTAHTAVMLRSDELIDPDEYGFIDIVLCGPRHIH
jgi:hypothetical protein